MPGTEYKQHRMDAFAYAFSAWRQSGYGRQHPPSSAIEFRRDSDGVWRLAFAGRRGGARAHHQWI